jgi:hypothetical protein
MSWIRFISWLGGLYALYYLLNILWDALRGKGGLAAAGSEELHFEEGVTPQQVSAAESVEKKKAPKGSGEPVVSAIGGVNLKDLFNLAKAEVIAYNRAVSF